MALPHLAQKLASRHLWETPWHCRVPPDARLGKLANRTVITPLGIVRREGGIVPRTLVRLQRCCPVTYFSQNRVMTPRAHGAALRDLESRAAKASPAQHEPPVHGLTWTHQIS